MEAKVLHIGRGDENEIVLKHPSISRRHAQLIFDPEGNAFISDLQSTNGTFVNGQKVMSSYPLNRGDKVELGDRVGLDWQKYMPQDKKPSAEIPLSPPAVERKKTSSKTIILAVVLGVLVLATGGIIFIKSDSKPAPGPTIPPGPTVDPLPSANSISMNTLLNTGKDKLNAYVGHAVTECPSDTILYSKVEPMCYFIIQNGKFLDYKTPKVATAPAPVEPAPPIRVGRSDTTARSKPSPMPKKASIPEYRVHKVKTGETLSGIVALYNSKGCPTKKQKVMDYNAMDNENDFKVDDILYIPCN
jgi:pSer/pThr/pTyr-binding forkhead associated (FHA) protein